MKLAVAAIVATQAALGLYLGLPGQLSTDSIVQLYEGRTLTFISFNPPFMSILLGALDRLGIAAIGFVVLSQALLLTATWLFLSPPGRPTWWQLVLAAVVVLNPVMLIYVGIVWKDVLLAHAVVLLYALIAWLQWHRKPLTLPFAALIVALLIVIAGARQQGLLFAIPAALWAATLAPPSRRIRLAAAIVLLAIPWVVSRALDLYVSHRRIASQPDAVSTGWRLLTRFDLAGILANGGAPPPGTSTALAEEMREQSLLYSPYRVDTLTGGSRELWALDNAATMRLWRATIVANPDAYLRHRATHFAAFLGFDDIQACLPVYTGIGGPVIDSHVGGDLAAFLGLRTGPTRTSPRVFDFGLQYGNTPLFMHAAYAGVLAVIGILLFRRREFVLLTLAVCSLLLLGSYFFVSIACDFRYAYTLTVATTLLAAYVCVSARLGPGGDSRKL